MLWCLQPTDVRAGLVSANVLFPGQSVPQWRDWGHISRRWLQTWCYPNSIPSHRACDFLRTSLGGSCAVLHACRHFCCLVLHVSSTPDGVNGAEFDVFEIKRNIERRCTVGLGKFTKSSGYDSTDRACGLYCLPDSQNKAFLLFSVWGWGMHCFGGVLSSLGSFVVLHMTVTRIADQTADSLKPMSSQLLRITYGNSDGLRR